MGQIANSILAECCFKLKNKCAAKKELRQAQKLQNTDACASVRKADKGAKDVRP